MITVRIVRMGPMLLVAGLSAGWLAETGLAEYAAGTWTPRPDDTPSVVLTPGVRATGR